MKPFKRVLICLFALSLAAVVGVAGVNLLMMIETSRLIVSPADAAPADCILVLGSGLLADGTPGETLTRRLDTALDLYEHGIAPKLLMSGDHARDDYDEVNAMKRYAVAHGVPANCVFMDHAGFSTYESMVRARQVFGCERVLVVTQGYHMYRALWDALCQGMTAQGVTSERYYYSPGYTLWLDVREVLARCKDAALCLLHVPVATPDESIPITGSGAATDDNATAAWLAALPAVP